MNSRVLPRARRRVPGQRRNTDVFLTWPFAEGGPVATVATVDGFDVAHGLTDREGFLLPGPVARRARSGATRPRRYPPALLTAGRRTWDQVFSAGHERLIRLEGTLPSAPVVAGRVQAALAMMTPEQARALGCSGVDDGSDA